MLAQSQIYRSCTVRAPFRRPKCASNAIQMQSQQQSPRLSLEEHLARELERSSAGVHMVPKTNVGATYRPSTRQRTDNRARDSCWSHTSCALEKGSTDRARCHAVERIVLPTHRTNCAVDSIVKQCHHTRRVSQERSSSCDSVQHGVQSQLWWCRCGYSVQSFGQTPGATYR